MVKKRKIPGCWKLENSVDSDFIMFETKKRSRVYPTQPDKYVNVHRHYLDNSKWTFSYGNAAINHPFANSKEQALDWAFDHMELWNICSKRRK